MDFAECITDNLTKQLTYTLKKEIDKSRELYIPWAFKLFEQQASVSEYFAYLVFMCPTRMCKPTTLNQNDVSIILAFCQTRS